MIYSKEDILNLIKSLDSYDGKYEALVSIFQTHLEDGHLNFGIGSESGSVGAALLMLDLQIYFPDAAWALAIPKEDLPLYVEDIGMESPIAHWRLKNDR